MKRPNTRGAVFHGGTAARQPTMERYEGEAESGPSRISLDALRDRPVSARRSAQPSMGVIVLGLLGLLPLASALPPPTRTRPLVIARTDVPEPTTSTSTYYSQASHKRHSLNNYVGHLNPVTSPSGLPTVSIAVDEKTLPYYLSLQEDGRWSKVDNAWYLYGRYAGSQDEVLAGSYPLPSSISSGVIPNPTPTPVPVSTSTSTSASTSSTSTSDFAIDQALPNGWGVSSSRSSFYKVPLIVVASIVLAFLLVATIIWHVLHSLPFAGALMSRIAWSRRKAHRKRKRKAERLRRKALAAAGISPDSLDGSAAEAAFKEKLQELEEKHRRSRKTNGPGFMVRTKVRNWQGLRRRKGKKQDDDPSQDIVEDKPVEQVDGIDTRSSTPVIERPSEASTTPLVNADETSGTISDSPTTTESAITSPIPAPSHDAAAPGPISAVAHFPPAYRPASVRSMQRDSARGQASSSSAGPSDVRPPPAHFTEKTSAPGYYPAPTTEESERAIAVASRSDGKRRMLPDEEDELEDSAEPRVRHVATDDKVELERMRLAGSAPPIRVTGPESRTSDDQHGPSAPNVEVDEAGFERLDLTEALDDFELANSLPRPPASPLSASEALIPPPPRPVQRSLRTLSQSEGSPVIDEQHLLPSAPPAASSEAMPSAPPLDDRDEHEETEAPTAPMLDASDSEEDSASPDHDPSDSASPIDAPISSMSSSDPVPTEAPTSTTTRPVVFLPKYEP